MMGTCHQPLLHYGGSIFCIKMAAIHAPLLQAFIYVFRSLGWVDFLYEDGHVSPATPPGLYICTLVTRVGRYIMMGTCQEPLLQAFLYVPQSLGWVDFGIKMAIYVTSHSSRPLHICTVH